MGTRANVQRRLAVGIAGALLVSALVGNLAPVGAADADQDLPSQERDINVGKEATGLAGDGHFVITEVAAPAITVVTQQAAPNPEMPLNNGRDDRD